MTNDNFRVQSNGGGSRRHNNPVPPAKSDGGIIY